MHLRAQDTVPLAYHPYPLIIRKRLFHRYLEPTQKVRYQYKQQDSLVYGRTSVQKPALSSQKACTMIQYASENQLPLSGFETPFETALEQNNRWVKLA